MAGQNIIGAASITPQVMVSQQLGTSEVAIYTCAAATSAKVAQASLCNITGSPVAVYLSIVKAGGLVSDGSHRIISGYSLAANDTLALDMIRGAMLGPGDSIAAYAAAATAVDVVITGTVHS